MLEKEIESKLRDGIRKVGGRAYKWVSPGNTGVPDRIITLPGGRVIFIELKREGEKPRPVQKAQISFLKKLGMDVRVLTGLDEVNAFLEEVMPHDL